MTMLHFSCWRTGWLQTSFQSMWLSPCELLVPFIFKTGCLFTTCNASVSSRALWETVSIKAECQLWKMWMGLNLCGHSLCHCTYWLTEYSLFCPAFFSLPLGYCLLCFSQPPPPHSQYPVSSFCLPLSTRQPRGGLWGRCWVQSEELLKNGSPNSRYNPHPLSSTLRPLKTSHRTDSGSAFIGFSWTCFVCFCLTSQNF